MAGKERGPVGERLIALRRQLECTQVALAGLLGVTQTSVAFWESGKVKPSAMACKAIAKYDKANAAFWIEQSGESMANRERRLATYKHRNSYVHEDMLIVPILSSVIAAGIVAQVETMQDEYEGSIAVPLPKGGETSGMVAARVSGHSMEPKIPHGSLVVIDTRYINPEENIGYVVAARGEDGITIKTLHREWDMYLLVAGNPDFTPLIQPIDGTSRWDIAGRVVYCFTEPATPKAS